MKFYEASFKIWTFSMRFEEFSMEQHLHGLQNGCCLLVIQVYWAAVICVLPVSCNTFNYLTLPIIQSCNMVHQVLVSFMILVAKPLALGQPKSRWISKQKKWNLKLLASSVDWSKISLNSKLKSRPQGKKSKILFLDDNLIHAFVKKLEGKQY